jgi:hypothetical protein
MSGVILAIDLGKYKSVACLYRAVVPQSAVHPPRLCCGSANNTAPTWSSLRPVCWPVGFTTCSSRPALSARWPTPPLRPGSSSTHKDDALRLAQLQALGQLPTVCVPDPAIRQWRQLIA